MKKNTAFFSIRISLFFVICFCYFCPTCPAQSPPVFEELKLISSDRILVFAPHPDDEVIACGGIIQKAIKLGIPIKVVFLTYGDNNQWSFLFYRKHPVFMPNAVRTMGMVRHDEAIEADKNLGILPENLIFLGYPDFRTLNIWYRSWGQKSQPTKGMLTHVTAVPYKNAFRPGAPYKGEEILKDIEDILKEFKPTKIFVSHPADHNPEHRAFYLFTRVALWDLQKEIKAELFPYLVHYKGWPKPRGYFPEKNIEPPGFFDQRIEWKAVKLTPEEIKLKHDALKLHRSEYVSSGKYLLSFVCANELFGGFPEIKLESNLKSGHQLSEKTGQLNEIPEHLTEEERLLFVGLQERSIYLEGDQLVVSIKLTRPLGKTVGIAVNLCGYRYGRDFAEMPKLDIRFGAAKYKIFDQRRIVSKKLIRVKRKAKEIVLWIPLEVLENPQYILTSARTYLGALPLDWMAWRTVFISGYENMEGSK